jgi:hypothetical protein
VWSGWAVVCRKAKQRKSGRASPDPGGHRPKGTARPAITPLVAGEILVCESSLVQLSVENFIMHRANADLG